MLYNNQPIVDTINVLDGNDLEISLEINEPFTINSIYETFFENNILKIKIPVLEGTNLDTTVEIVTDSKKVFKIPITIQSKYVSFIVGDNE